jgi:TetR/AcrR family acrAB operon transcriptional repressor
MVRRTKEEAMATRHRILDAAELIFERRGVSRTSLHEIAQAAGVTRGAIYWHFEDKADLFNAMMDRATMPMEAVRARPADKASTDDPLPMIERRLIAVLRFTATRPQLRRVFDIATHKVEYVDELVAVRDRHLTCRNACLDETERLLRSAMRRGQVVSTAPARSVAVGIHALVDGLLHNWMMQPEAFDLVRVGRHVIRTYLAGLRPPAVADAAARPAARRKQQRETAA